MSIERVFMLTLDPIHPANLARVRPLAVESLSAGGQVVWLRDGLAWTDHTTVWILRQQQRWPLVAHTGYIAALAVNRDETRLASASHDHTVRLWDMPNAETLTAFTRKTNLVIATAFNPAGTILASTGDEDTTLQLWDIARQQVRGILTQADTIQQIDFSPDSTRLLAADAAGRVALWNVPQQQLIASITHDNVATSARFHPHGTYIATASHDQTVKLWDHLLQRHLHGFSAPAEVNCLNFDHTGELLLAGDWEGNISGYDVPSAAHVHTLPSPTGAMIYTVALNAAATLLASVDEKALTIWGIPA